MNELETYVRSCLLKGVCVVWREQRDTGSMYDSCVFVIADPRGGFIGGAQGGWGAIGCRHADTIEVAREHAERFLAKVG